MLGKRKESVPSVVIDGDLRDLEDDPGSTRFSRRHGRLWHQYRKSITLRITLFFAFFAAILFFFSSSLLPTRRADYELVKVNGESWHEHEVMRIYNRTVVDPFQLKPSQTIRMNDLKLMSPEAQQAVFEAVRFGRTAIDPGPNKLHGHFGLNVGGIPKWTPSPPPPEGLSMAEALRAGGGFNLRFSDSQPLDRIVADATDLQCRDIVYREESMPPATVIIVFFNEPFSTLMRSVHSVLNYSPPSLLKEIILVDDGSKMPWIKAGSANNTKPITGSEPGDLDSYIASLPKTRLVRLPVRKGIVGARMAGIRAATSSIFVILDSHVEVQPRWLEPIVARINDDPRRVVMPIVDGMEAENMMYNRGGIGCTLGFLWKLMEHSFDQSESGNYGPTDAIKSPTMAGGLFAANVDFFLNKLGGYDELFEFWGTENLELSFRLWQCGGVLECIQCSRVYHIFRKGGVGYSSPVHSVTKNKMRTLAIWMDEYADLAYRVIGEPDIYFGEYQENIEWRKKQGCKDFKWFLHEVFPQSFIKDLPADCPYLGTVQNTESKLCLTLRRGDSPIDSYVTVAACTGTRAQQFMYFSRPEFIMPVSNDENCLVGYEGRPSDGNVIQENSLSRTVGRTDWCSKFNSLHSWHLDHTVEDGDVTKMIIRNNEICLGVVNGMLSYETKCDPSNPNVVWTWTNYNPPKTWTPPPLRRVDTQ